MLFASSGGGTSVRPLTTSVSTFVCLFGGPYCGAYFGASSSHVRSGVRGFFPSSHSPPGVWRGGVVLRRLRVVSRRLPVTHLVFYTWIAWLSFWQLSRLCCHGCDIKAACRPLNPTTRGFKGYLTAVRRLCCHCCDIKAACRLLNPLTRGFKSYLTAPLSYRSSGAEARFFEVVHPILQRPSPP